MMRAILISLLLALSACGVSPGCRTVSTGLGGAALGAAAGAIGGNAGLSALIGGGVGAIAGGATSPYGAYAGPSPLCY